MHLAGICFVSAAVLLFTTSVAGTQPAGAVGGCIPGTYLAVEDSGTQSLWTFSSDGTFHATSSAESALNFSLIHGSWQRDGARTARAVGLDFVLRPQPEGAGVPPQAIARIDASMTFSRDCRQFAGAFNLRFYNAVADDPLNTAIAPSFSDTLTGRRVLVP
jgi:hypothetical protein